MFQFIRTVDVKSAAAVPAALKFATEVTAYLNKKYSLDARYGIELFSRLTLHWHLQTDSLEKLSALNAKLMQDREYFGILENAKDLWVDGSLKDTLVNIVE